MYFFFFYPLGLDRSARCRPVLTVSMLAVFTVAFFWIHDLAWLFAFNPWNLVYFPGFSPPWALATAAFMHNGWAHLLGNMVYFWVFAPALEGRLGRARFLLYFLLWAVAGNLVHGWVSVLGLLGQGGLGVMGASGAIAGMLGYSLLRLQGARVEIGWWVLAPLVGQNRAGRTPVPLVVAVLLWVAWQVIQASLADLTGSTVSYGAHLGGFGLGLLMAVLLGAGREGRAEKTLARGQRYMRAGHFGAAAGEFRVHLELAPASREGRLELARTLVLLGQKDEAIALYRRVYAQDLESGDIDGLLDVAGEWLRQFGPGVLEPEELNRIAHYQELKLDAVGALATYRRLHEAHPGHPLAQRALVRIVVLAAGKARQPETAARYLDLGRRALPPGPWREFLEGEFSAPGTADAGCGAPPEPAVPAG